MWTIRDGTIMLKTVETEAMLRFLQEEFTRALYEMKHYGDHHAERRMDAVIAQKELVEAMICAPVNLRLDTETVTVGY